MIVVFGGSGMLGKQVALEVGRAGYDCVAPSRAECDITNPYMLRDVRRRYRPEMVINCAGEPHEDSLTNSLGPWYIARVFTCRVLHVSTDCVFPAKGNGAYDITAAPMPDTSYGMSKLLGEQQGQQVTNLRTSFIGYDHGLLHWFMNQEKDAVVEGYTKASWSGSTVYAVARGIARVMQSGTVEKLRNIEHLCTAVPCTKYYLLTMLASKLRPDVTVLKNSNVIVQRDMIPTYILPVVDNEIDELSRVCP